MICLCSVLGVVTLVGNTYEIRKEVFSWLQRLIDLTDNLKRRRE
jgi:hypothetical protein